MQFTFYCVTIKQKQCIGLEEEPDNIIHSEQLSTTYWLNEGRDMKASTSAGSMAK